MANNNYIKNQILINLWRQQIQKSIDAIVAAMQLTPGIDPTQPLTTDTYLQVERTLHSNVALEELALQGHGLNSPLATKYYGYTNDLQNSVDNSTLYVGTGLNQNQRAIGSFLDDSVITHMPFTVAFHNGQLVQYNQNGSIESTVGNAVAGFNNAAFLQNYNPSSFSTTAVTPTTTTPPATIAFTNPLQSIFGGVAAAQITTTNHIWNADPTTGLYTTTADLATEWKANYQALQSGQTLSALQHLEANAQAVFENTGINKKTAAQIATYRQDAQRSFDAIAAAISLTSGIDPSKPLTVDGYLAVERTLQGNTSLEELAVQGHGLNNPPAAKYNGFTNDFQNNVDTTTLFVGSGINHNQRALTALFDDSIITHMPFGTITQNGVQKQLNQNGDVESSIYSAVDGFNSAAYTQTYSASSFSTNLNGNPLSSIVGGVAPSTISATAHTWSANATTGLYTTTADLATEWKANYQALQSGQTLSLVQHLEATAEAVFENTAINTKTAAQIATYRQDTQRNFDAIALAVSLTPGVDPSKPLTADQYLQVEHTLHNNLALEDLGIQGHGLNTSPTAKYRGYTNDFQNGVDTKTLYVGTGLDQNQNALTAFFDDVVMTHIPYSTVFHNGVLVQLNQNGAVEDTVTNAVAGFNDAGFLKTYQASDFSTTAVTPTPTTPNTSTSSSNPLQSIFGGVADAQITTTAHIWNADPTTGLYTTTADLATEWKANYQALQSGQTLSVLQHLEANAEAVFENTAINQQSAQNIASYRQDVQRKIDAIAAAIALTPAVDSTKPLSQDSYLGVGTTLQGNIDLLELANQGTGLNKPPSIKYNGFTNDFQALDKNTLFIGNGVNHNQNALSNFVNDTLLGHLESPVISQNGELKQLNQNGDVQSSIYDAITNFNDAAYNQSYNSASFSLYPNGNPLYSIAGGVAPSSITNTAHTWTADSTTGMYTTTANLSAEWQSAYQSQQQGQTLNPMQHLQAAAQSVFENSSIGKYQQKISRWQQDIQRNFDAIVAAVQASGIDPTQPLTTDTYLQVERTLHSNVALEELALQGHGLNSPLATKYYGYTNDLQNSVDNSTLYVGTGLNQNQRAIGSFLDDSVITHMPFTVAFHNGQLVQYNQNGSIESTVGNAVAGFNNAAFLQNYNPSSFSTTAVTPTTTTPPATIAFTNPLQSIFGGVAAAQITTTNHIWNADPTTGLYTTTADLATEWKANYQALQSGQTLSALQHLEANAQAVFENTGINKKTAAQIATYRQDAQRSFDAIAAAISLTSGIDPSKPLTVDGYLAVERTLQGNTSLEELAVQGHGLNNPPAAKYNGFTNDFQNNVDTTTLFVGSGINHNQRALTALFDDSIITHMPFGTITQNGVQKQLNQNGDVESSIYSAVDGFNSAAYTQTYSASSFSTNLNGNPLSSIVGGVAPSTISATAHTWSANATTGLYTTTADLATEWKANYQALQSGQTLSLVQHLEATAEAVFENTAINTKTAAQIATYRQDTQRNFDAIALAVSLTPGVDPSKPLTADQYLQVEHTLHNNLALEDLGIQGHGLNTSPTAKYRGYTNDFQNGVDTKTLYVGTGLDQNQNALTAFFDDVVMTHIPYSTVFHNGVLVQLNQNGAVEDTVTNAVAGFNDAGFLKTYQASDFSTTAVTPTPTTPNTSTSSSNPLQSIFGGVADAQITTTAHIWNADPTTGLYTTTADLATEWKANYQALQSGQTLSVLQHLEANAEAVFENTAINQQSAQNIASYRQDVQRKIDAIAAAIALTPAVDSTKPLSQDSYLGVGTTLQGNIDLLELANQGTGLNKPPSIKYNGFTNDFQALDKNTLFIGNGVNHNQNALSNFVNDTLLGHLESPVISQNGELKQLNQNGDVQSSIYDAITNFNDAAYNQSYNSASFSLYPNGNPLYSIAGGVAPSSITNTAHTWTADSTTGMYTTAADLNSEWQSAYKNQQQGQTLNLMQHLQASAEAVFENINIPALGPVNADSQVLAAALNVAPSPLTVATSLINTAI